MRQLAKVFVNKTSTGSVRLHCVMLAILGMSITSAVIRPGEVGIKQKLGQLSENVATQGTVLYNPFTSKVVKTSIQTNNLDLSLSLPSKEG